MMRIKSFVRGGLVRCLLALSQVFVFVMVSSCSGGSGAGGQLPTDDLKLRIDGPSVITFGEAVEYSLVGTDAEVSWLLVDDAGQVIEQGTTPPAAAYRVTPEQRSAAFLERMTLSATVGDATSPQSVSREIVARPKIKNAMVFFTEDQGTFLSLLGTPGLSSPKMDELAASSVLFPNANITMATCTGAKSTIYTGLSNSFLGVTGNVQEFIGSAEDLARENPAWLSDPRSAYNMFKIRDDARTLVEVVQEQGFYSATQNKLHMAPHTKFPFDEWYQDTGDNYQQVRRFIGKAAELGQPFFLNHVIGNPHRPYPNSDLMPLDVVFSEVDPPAHLPATATSRKDWAEFLQGIQNADVRVGEVIRALTDEGVLDETAIVFIADHGPAYHRGKFTTYGLGTEVFMAWRIPGVEPRVHARVPASGLDVMPTMLDLLDLPVPEGLHGNSAEGFLYGVDAEYPRQFAVTMSGTDRAIYDGRYRLVYMPNPAGTIIPDDVRLFDPWGNRVYEHTLNLADDPQFAEAYRFLDLADSRLTRFDRPVYELYDTWADPWEVDDLLREQPVPLDARLLRDSLLEELERIVTETQDRAPMPSRLTTN